MIPPFKLILIFTLLINFPVLVSAANRETIKITATDLDFGTIIVTNQPARVTITQDGQIILEGGAIEYIGTNMGRLAIKPFHTKALVKVKVSFDKVVDLGHGVLFKPITNQNHLIAHGKLAAINLYGTLEIPARVKRGQYSGLLQMNLNFY